MCKFTRFVSSAMHNLQVLHNFKSNCVRLGVLHKQIVMQLHSIDGNVWLLQKLISIVGFGSIGTAITVGTYCLWPL